jgi:hypothetical protein
VSDGQAEHRVRGLEETWRLDLERIVFGGVVVVRRRATAREKRDEQPSRESKAHLASLPHAGSPRQTQARQKLDSLASHETLPRVPPAPSRSQLIEIALHTWAGVCLVVGWVAPYLLRAVRLVVAGLARLAAATATVARHVLRHRATIATVLTRAAWWGALWLWLVAGQSFFDLRQPLDGAGLALRIIPGFVLCSFVLSLATERRMRCAAWILGLGHGALGLLALTLFGA